VVAGNVSPSDRIAAAVALLTVGASVLLASRDDGSVRLAAAYGADAIMASKMCKLRLDEPKLLDWVESKGRSSELEWRVREAEIEWGLLAGDPHGLSQKCRAAIELYGPAGMSKAGLLSY